MILACYPEAIEVFRGVIAALVACIVRRHKRHNADSIDCVSLCQAMTRFQITKIEETKAGALYDRCRSSGNPGCGRTVLQVSNSCRKNSMISYEEEIKRFKPSLDVDQIEDAIAKVDLTDMNDIMTSLIEEAIKQKKDESAR